MIMLPLVLGNVLAQIDPQTIITLELTPEKVEEVHAIYDIGNTFSVAVKLSPPCAKALSQITENHIGSYIRVTAFGDEILFARVVAPITGGDMRVVAGSTMTEAQMWEKRLQPPEHVPKQTTPLTADTCFTVQP